MSSDNKDAAPNGTNGVDAITEALQATSIEELGRKVFVGNLNFATHEEQLREIFSKHGTITEVQIIYRSSRSLGYGFVTYATAEEADKAVALTDKTEIEGRTINVEIAKPTPPPRTSRGASGHTKSEKKSADEDKENDGDHPNAARSSRVRRGRGRGRGRWARSGRSRRPAADPKSEANGGDDPGASTDASAPNEGNQSTKSSSRRSRSRRSKGTAPGESRPRKVGPPEGPPSKTLLFVANLPFGLTDEGLKEFFSAYTVTSAHVVRRRYGSTVGKSKGFGFVEFDCEESQLRALAETQGKEIEGRALQVKVAISESKNSGNESGGAATAADSEPGVAPPAAS